MAAYINLIKRSIFIENDTTMILKIFLIILIFLGLAVGFFAFLWRPISEQHPALLNGTLPPTIPLRDFYANQDSKYLWALSSDGKKLTWIETKWFKPILRIKNLSTGETSSVRPPKGFLGYLWAPDQKTILFSLDAKGREHQKIASIDTTELNSDLRIFDFGEKTTSFVYHIPKQKTDTILIAHNGRDPSSFEIYRLNIQTGKTEPFGELVGHQTTYTLDHAGNILGRTVFTNPQSADWSFEVPTDNDSWKEIAKGNYTQGIISLDQMAKDGTIYALSNRGRDKISIVEFDLTNGEEKLVYTDPDIDLSGATINPDTNELLMVTSFPGYQKRVFFDEAFKKDVESLNLSQNASFYLVSQTTDFTKTLAQINTADAAYEIRLIDREKRTAETINKADIAKHRDKLSPIEPVFINAQDGLKIPAYLSRPKGVDKPVPLVILIHGGPHSRTIGDYYDLRALLNNRGYAVLDVNYRGSSGYGRKFMEAAKGEVAGKMSSDIIDARAWAVEQGIADPQKVALYGVSWGGFEVLTALIQNSDLFAAGISINGITDLKAMIAEVPEYWRSWSERMTDYIGDPNTDVGKEELLKRSPISHASKMKTPLLLVQGANDVRVVQSQSGRMVKLLEEAGAPVEYHLIKGIGHNPIAWPWQERYLNAERIERFLAEHLGGRTGHYDYAKIGAYILP